MGCKVPDAQFVHSDEGEVVATVTVYGSSDDLIEIDGDISEEFSVPAYNNPTALLAFSDGTVLRITYTPDGLWRITPVTVAGEYVLHQATDEATAYSDRATLSGDITWVVLGTEIARAV